MGFKRLTSTLALVITFTITGMSSEQKVSFPQKIESKIQIDGEFLEPEWEKAPVLSEFVQFEPSRGEPATHKTEARILYSDKYLFFAVNCFDPEPEKIIGRLTRRDDNLKEDDAAGIYLDTFFDRRTAYYFFTNPIGTQMDGRIADNGRTTDATWDGEWLSAAKITPAGWQVEIAIPLSAIKYKPGKNISWGIGLVRTIPRKLETDTWTGPMEFDSRVSQFGILSGMILKKSSERIMMIPHMISRFQKGEKVKSELGVDARYAFSQDISANLTVNPDFATVEADQEQINLTRFELQLPEKRNFFLEGSEIYSQRIRLFYSRRISDIYGGIKLYGKKGGYEFSAMTVQSRPDEETDTEDANFSVFRLRKDIFKTSTIGFLAANKFINGKHHGNIGLDLVHFFSDKVNVTGQLAVSYGDHSTENIAFFLRPSYDSSTFHIHLRYTQLGKNFADNANSVGFIRDDDRHEFDSAIEKKWWIKKHGIDKITYDSNYNIYWSTDWELRSWQINQELGIDLTNKFSLESEYINEYKLYEKDFHNHQIAFSLGYNTREWQSVRLQYEYGRNFDSDFRLIGATVQYKLLKSMAIQYELNRLYLDPDPDGDTTWIHALRFTNYFTKDLFFKLFFQTNTAIDKTSIQALMVYRFQPPFGTFQLAYQRGSLRFGDTGSRGDSIFLKISCVL